MLGGLIRESCSEAVPLKAGKGRCTQVAGAGWGAQGREHDKEDGGAARLPQPPK